MDKISQVMERYRLSAGRGGMPLSYAELGRRIGVSRTQAENFCKGRSIPSDEAVLRISDEIGYDEMRLLVLQHHDRAPLKVKPVWKDVMDKLEQHKGGMPTVDPRIIELLTRYVGLGPDAKEVFLKMAGLFIRMKVAFQEHLVGLVERWTGEPQEMVPAVEEEI